MCHPKGRGPDESGPPGEQVDIDVPGGPMPGLWFQPEAPTAGPVVMIPDIYGATPFYQGLSSRLAVGGHPTLLVDYFYQAGELAELTREAAFARLASVDGDRALSDVEAAIELAGRNAGGLGRVGTLGFCLGGQLGLLLAAQRRDLVTGCFYAFPEGVSASMAVHPSRPIDLAADITGPIFAVWGDEDYIPVATIERFAAEMDRHGADYRWRLVPGHGHGFLQGLESDAPVAVECWREMSEFFSNHLSEAR